MNLENKLIKRIRGKVAIVGIGNIMRADDGFGPELCKRLREKVNAECIDAGLSPENYVGKIAKLNPGTVIFLDALSLGEDAGTVKMLEKEEIANEGFTTHDMPAALIIDYLQSQIKADIFMIGVQAKNTTFGEAMSPEVKEKIRYLEGLFKKLLGEERIHEKMEM